MNILYLTNVPVPQNRETDAHFQELDLLVKEFGGEIISAFPLAKPSSLLPRFLYGFHNWSAIKRAIENADIIHVFSSVLHPFRYLKRMEGKMVIYSVLTPIPQARMVFGVGHYVLYDAESKNRMLENGNANVSVSPPFVRFKKQTLEIPKTPFTLLMASAPWERSQFDSKGIYLLLEVLGRIPDLNITFVWRDILFDEMDKLVKNSPYSNRINLINGRINIGDYLRSSHAVVLLSKNANLVKSYPHSLLEGMLAARPILVSSTIPISTEIRDNNYGQVVSDFNLDALEHGIIKLKNNYKDYVNRLAEMPDDRFSKTAFLNFYQKLYSGQPK